MAEPSMTQQPLAQAPQDDDQVRLLDLAIVLAKHKKLILGLPLLAALLALGVVFAMPQIYTATTRLLPPQQKESSAAAMLGTLAGTGGGLGTSVGQALGLKYPNDLYVGILKSQTIADGLIERFRLKELYNQNTMTGARKSLENVSRIIAGRDGIIMIEVEDTNPQRAADMANAYVDALEQMMQNLAVTEASQRRLFFERQLAKEREQLIGAEVALRKAIETKGIAGVDAQSRTVVATTEQLRTQIAVKEIQLDAMRSFATERNPEAVRLRQEIASMKAELGRFEGGRRDTTGGASPVGLENVRKLREVKFLEFSVELLTKQYEIAKIDEAKDAVLIQVVDKAVPPDYKSKPKRALIVILTALTFGVLAVLWAFAREAFETSRADPEGAKRLKALYSYMRFR